MRSTIIAFAAGAISLGMIMGTAQAEAAKVTPNLTVFTKDQTTSNGQGPIVLRGSATKRGTVHGSSSYDDRGPIEVGAGSTLWLVDPDTGDIIACEPRRTSRVGSRYVHCFDGPSPY